jgi:N-acylglucosamine 2-epimerase
MNNILNIAERYRAELEKSVIPFWENNCPDREQGGYFTCLDADGSVFDQEKFMWMQWRIVYMFSVLYENEPSNPNWLTLAQNGFDFLTKHGKSEDGSYFFALNRSGEPSIAPYNIFSDCFAAMGAAALYKATGETKYRLEAESAMNSYIGRMDCPKGKWEKKLSGTPSRRNLGHYMILANLGQVMHECLGTDQYNEDTADAIDIVINQFCNKEYQIVFENINSDGTVDLESSDGRHIIPGHGLESMWFIMQYAERNGNQALIDKAAEATLWLLEFGWDKQYGGIYYFMDLLDKPHVELQADMKLWWVHNEALIATLYAYKLTGRQEFWDWFLKIDEWSWSRYPDREHGEWFGYLNRQGEVSHSLKGGKWKTFFHLPRCLLLSSQLLKEIAASNLNVPLEP